MFTSLHACRWQSRATHDCCFSQQHPLCRELIEEGVAAVKAFQGKQLFGAICGQRYTINTVNLVKMQKLCHDHNIVILLPNGKDTSIGHSCIQSLKSKSHRPSASMQRAQHTVPPRLVSCHQPRLIWRCMVRRFGYLSIRPAVLLLSVP